MSDTKDQELSKPLLSGPTYDKLKLVAQIILPALGALYFGIASIWGLPNAEEVVGTITVIDLFLGTILGISSETYKKAADGTVTVTHQGMPTNFSLDMYTEELADVSQVRMRVMKLPPDVEADRRR